MKDGSVIVAGLHVRQEVFDGLRRFLLRELDDYAALAGFQGDARAVPCAAAAFAPKARAALNSSVVVFIEIL